jgi:hypothetical protein
MRDRPLVRLALERAGLGPHPRRVAHSFRQSLATRMIRRGASMAEIAEVLPHRSQSTTAIYESVARGAAPTVARALADPRRCPMSALHDALAHDIEVRRALGTKLLEPAATLVQLWRFSS